MIFQHTWQYILDGSKTQTSRLVKRGDTLANGAVKARTKDGLSRIKWRIGAIYSVTPGWGKHSIAKIQITDISLRDVRMFTPEDVSREGFQSKAEFLAVWAGMHDPAAAEMLRHNPNCPLFGYKDRLYTAWVLQFEVVPEGIKVV